MKCIDLVANGKPWLTGLSIGGGVLFSPSKLPLVYKTKQPSKRLAATIGLRSMKLELVVAFGIRVTAKLNDSGVAEHTEARKQPLHAHDLIPELQAIFRCSTNDRAVARFLIAVPFHSSNRMGICDSLSVQWIVAGLLRLHACARLVAHSFGKLHTRLLCLLSKAYNIVLDSKVFHFCSFNDLH